MKNYERLFSQLEAPEPPAGLTRTILLRIDRRARRVLMAKIAASACVFAGSLWMIGVGYIDFQASLAQTGFLQFGSLLFSDFSFIVSNLPDFALSMIESFPIFSAAAILGGLAFAIWSSAAMFDEISMVGTKKFS